MRLLKEYEDFVHWADWRIEEPVPGIRNLLGWSMVCFWVPSEGKNSVVGYYWQVRLPVEADELFKEAGKEYAYRMLVKNFDLALSSDHEVMRSIEGLKPYKPWLQRLLHFNK